MKIKRIILSLAELIVAAVLAVGSQSFFSACKSEGGMHMACHWAQNAVTLLAAVIALQALIKIFIPNKDIKTGLALSVFTLAVSAILVPGTVISLCMMDTMRCHTVFQPAVIVVSSVLAAIAGVDALLGLLRQRKEK